MSRKHPHRAGSTVMPRSQPWAGASSEPRPAVSIASLPTPAARTSVPDVKHGDVLTARPAEAIVEALRARGFELVQSTANATHWQIRKRCYGCDSAAVGLRDRRPEGG